MTSGQELLADSYDYYFYARSPTDDPMSTGGVTAVIRGDVLPHGGMEYTDWPVRPYPAWMRSDSSVGGIRCARDDGPSTVPEAFYRRRQELLSGRRGVEP